MSKCPRIAVMEEYRRRVLSKKRCRVDKNLSCVSVRRFASFGLLRTERVFADVSESNDGKKLDSLTSAKRHVWYRYTSPICSSFTADIRHLDEVIDLKEILGFNNTGNVCVWPSEEILTHYCLQRRETFRKKRVCELGGGMTCLSGVAVGLCTEAEEVLLTDGNETSVQNINVIIQKNKDHFQADKVSARVLRWNDCTNLDDLTEKFDIILAADCFFFDDFRADLVTILHRLLKPKGQVIAFAPGRSGTFERFQMMARDKFASVVRAEHYDETVWQLHQENVAKGVEVYDPDIHYPWLLKLEKT